VQKVRFLCRRDFLCKACKAEGATNGGAAQKVGRKRAVGEDKEVKNPTALPALAA
jgi:hypothetical protein